MCYEVLLFVRTDGNLCQGEIGSILPANANSSLSLVNWLGSLLCWIRRRINKAKTEIVCSERANHVCADSRTEVCDLTYSKFLMC